MVFSDEIKRNHMALGQVSARFVDFLEANQDQIGPVDFTGDNFLVGNQNVIEHDLYYTQSFPFYIGGSKLEEIKKATVGVARLVKEVPERLFQNDPQKIADFYGIPLQHVTFMMTPPTGISYNTARIDFIQSNAGFMCLEANTGIIGGWEILFFEKKLKENHYLAKFHTQNQLNPFVRPHIVVELEHMIRWGLKEGHGKSGVLNLALVVEEGVDTEPVAAHISYWYQLALQNAAPALSGRAVCCTMDKLREQSGKLEAYGETIQLLKKHCSDELPQFAHLLFKMKAFILVNSASHFILGDKRNLALISENPDCFDPQDRDLIHAHIPWTRILKKGETQFNGVPFNMEKDVLQFKDELVLKSAQGLGGEEVFIGRHTNPKEWRRRVGLGFLSGNWLIQQYHESTPYLAFFDNQITPADYVWGLFAMGDAFGGAVMRMSPKEAGRGVVNAKAGAQQGLMFEV